MHLTTNASVAYVVVDAVLTTNAPASGSQLLDNFCVANVPPPRPPPPPPAPPPPPPPSPPPPGPAQIIAINPVIVGTELTSWSNVVCLKKEDVVAGYGYVKEVETIIG